MVAFLGSFTAVFYAKIASQSVVRTIGFLLVFLLLISAALSLNSALMINPKLEHVQKWADDNLKNIPAIEVKGGVLIQPQETFVLEIGNDYSVFAVEADQKKEADILAKYKNVVMLTRTRFVFKQTGEDSLPYVRKRNFDKAKSWKISPDQSGFSLAFDNNQIAVTPDNVKKWLKVVSFFIFPAFLLVLFILYSFTSPLQILFFSLIGLMANAILKAQASYKQIFNICSYAIVPPTTLVTLLEVFRFRLPGFWFLFSSVYVLYIFLGLQSAKSRKRYG